MENVFIQNLTKNFLDDRMDEFLDILKDIPLEYWTKENFLTELNGKWKYSTVALNEEKNVIGYIIASEKESSIHIHKFMIANGYRNLGFGKLLLENFEKRCKDYNKNYITLKVYLSNIKAISFYKRYNFFGISRTPDLLLMGKNI